MLILSGHSHALTSQFARQLPHSIPKDNFQRHWYVRRALGKLTMAERDQLTKASRGGDLPLAVLEH